MSRTPSQQPFTAQLQQMTAGDAVATHSIEGTVRCIETATDRTAWTAESDGGIRIRGLPSGTILRNLERKNKTTFCNALLHVEGKMWAAYSDGFIRRFDAKTATLEREVIQHDGAIYTLHFAAGRVYSGGGDWKIYQWNPSSCEYQRLFFGHANSVRCLASAQTAHGPLLFSGSDDSTIRAWDPHAPLQSTKDVACIFTFKGHTKAVLALESVPERKQLWSGSEDGTIRVWNVETFQVASVLDRHRAPVAALAFVDTRMWSGGKDGTLFLWDAKTLAPILTLQEGIHVSPKYVMCIKKLYKAHYYKLWTSTSDGYIQCWNADATLSAEGFELLSSEEEVARKRDTARIEGLQAALYEHGAMLNAKEDEIKELQHRVQVLKDPTQNPDLIALNDRCDILTNDLEDVLRQREQLLQRCSMSDELLQATRKKLHESEVAQKSMHVANETLLGEMQILREALRTSESYKSQLASLTHERDDLKQVLSRQQEESSELQGVVRRLETAVRSHQHLFADNARLRREVEALEGSLQSEKQLVESLRHAVSAPTLRGPTSSVPRSGSVTRTNAASSSPRSPGVSARSKKVSPSPSLTKRHELESSDEDAHSVRSRSGGSARKGPATIRRDDDEEASKEKEPLLIPTTDDEEAPSPRLIPPVAEDGTLSGAVAAPSPRSIPPAAASSITALEERLDSLRLENESLTQQLQVAIQSREDELQRRNHELETLRADRESEALQLNQVLDKLKQETSKTIGELRASLKLAHTELASKALQHETSVSEAAAAQDAHRRELFKREKQLIDLRDSLTKSNSQVEALRLDAEKQSSSDAQEREVLKRQLSDARREKDRAEKALSDTQRQLTTALSRQQPPTEAVSSDVVALREKHVALQRDSDELSKELRSLKVIESRQGTEIALLKEQLVIARTQTEDLQSQLQNALEAAVQPQQSQKGGDAGSSSPLRSLTSSMSPLKASSPASPLSSSSAHAAATGEVSVLLVTLRNENDELRKERRHLELALQNALREAERETEVAIAVRSELTAVLDQRNEEAQSLREAMDFLREEKDRYDSLHVSFTELTAALGEAEHRESALRSRCTAEEQRVLAKTAEVTALQESLATLQRTCNGVQEAYNAVSKELEDRRQRVPSPVMQPQIQSPPASANSDVGFHTPETTGAVQEVIDELEEALQQKQQQFDEAQEAHEQTLEHLRVVTDDLAKCIEQRRSAEENLRAAEQALDHQRSDTVRLEKDLAAARDRLNRLEMEAPRTAASLREAQLQIADLRASSDATIRSLTLHVESASSRADALQRELDEVTRERNAVAERDRDNTRQRDVQDRLLTELRNNAEEQLHAVSDRDATIAILKDQIASISTDGSETKTKLQAHVSTLSVELQEAQSGKARAEIKIESLQRQCLQLQADVDTARALCTQLQTRSDHTEQALNQQVRSLETKLDDQARKVSELSQQLSIEVSAKKTLEMELDRERQESHNSQEEIRRLHTAILEAQAHQRTDEAARWNSERQLTSTQRTLQTLTEDHDSLLKECAATKAELQKALSEDQEQKVLLSEKVRSLQRDVDRLESTQGRTTASLELRERQLEAAHSRSNELQAELERVILKHEEELLRSTTRRDEAIRRGDEAVDKMRGLEARVAALTNENERLREHIERDRSLHDSTTAMLQESHATAAQQSSLIMSQSEEISQLKVALHSSEMTRDAVTKELESCRNAHDETIQAHSALSMQLFEKSQEAYKLSEVCSTLQGAQERWQSLSHSHEETLNQLADLKARFSEVDAALAATRSQLHHNQVYTSELEASLEVHKQTLHERKQELVNVVQQVEKATLRIADLENQDNRQKHRIAEAERERHELLKLRELTVDHAGAVEAVNQENLMMADQLAASEDLAAALASKVSELEERVAQTAGAEETIHALTTSQAKLEEDLARTQQLLWKKSEEAIDAVAAQDRVDYLTSKLDSAYSDVQRAQQKHDEREHELQQLLRERDQQHAALMRDCETRARELTAAEERLHVAEGLVESYRQQLNESANLKGQLVRLEQQLLQAREETQALQRRLAATGPLSQMEMEETQRQLETTLQAQSKIMEDQERSLDHLQTVCKADQGIIALLLSEKRVSRESESWIREVAELKAKVSALEGALCVREQLQGTTEQQSIELRSRVKLLEGLALRGAQGNVGSSSSSAWMIDGGHSNNVSHQATPNVSRAQSLQGASRPPLEGAESSQAEGEVSGVMTTHHNAQEGDDVHLVPTPQPTPRGTTMTSQHNASQQNNSLIPNPAMVRTYAEHLTFALQRSGEINQHLMRAMIQRTEGQRLLSERLGTVRAALMSNAGVANGSALATLIDDATTQQVAQLQAIVAAQRGRIEAHGAQLQQAREDLALAKASLAASAAEGNSSESDQAVLLAEVESAFEAKRQLLAEVTAERDVARADVHQKTLTIALLVDALRGASSSISGSGTLPQLSTLSAEVVSLEQALAERALTVRRLSDDLAAIQSNTLDHSALSHSLVQERERGALLEERLRVAERTNVQQSREIAELHVKLGQLRDDIQERRLEVEDVKAELVRSESKLDAANESMETLHRVIEDQEVKLQHQADALLARQRRKDELVAWVRDTPELKESGLQGFEERELYDTLVVCKHLLRLQQNAQEEARRAAKNQQHEEYEQLLRDANSTIALHQERLSQLQQDMRAAADDAAQWKERYEQATRARLEATQRAATAETEMLSIQEHLSAERNSLREAKTTVAQVATALRAKEELVESCQRRMMALECRIREVETDVQLRDNEIATLQHSLEGATRDVQLFQQLRKESEDELSVTNARVEELQDRITRLNEEAAARRTHTALLESRLQAIEERNHNESQSHESNKMKLEALVAHLRQENTNIAKLTDDLQEANAKSENLSRENSSLVKRLALAQELNNHLKEQNTVLEKHRAETNHLRSKLGTTASDVAQLRRLCTDGFMILPVDAEEQTVTGYLVTLEQYAARIHEEKSVLREVQTMVETMHSELVAARQASHQVTSTLVEGGGDRASLSLSPSLSLDVAGGARDTSRSASRSSTPVPTVATVRDLKAFLERFSVALKSVCIQQWHLVDALRAQRTKMLSLADNNKTLSEEVDVISNNLKQAASKLMRTENSEQLLSFIEPSRDVAVRTLFHVRDAVHDMKIHLTMLSGTVSQTKTHWIELYHQLSSELQPLMSLVQLAQSQVGQAFDRCLTAQEKEDLANDAVVATSGVPLSASSSSLFHDHVVGGLSTGEPALLSSTQTPRQTTTTTGLEPVPQLSAAAAAAPTPNTRFNRNDPLDEGGAFDGLRTIRPQFATPTHSSIQSSAIIGFGGESTANRDAISRGILEAKRREQQRSERER